VAIARGHRGLVVGFGAALGLTLLGLARVPDRPGSAGSQGAGGPALASVAVLPLSFARNVGQADGGVRFVAQGPAGGVYLTRSGAVVAPSGRSTEARADVLGMTLASADRDPHVSGSGLLPGRVNYLVGPRGDWHTAVPTYAAVVYRSVYPGIDLRYHGADGELDYDFDLAPGADPGRIAIDLTGAHQLRMDGAGSLLVRLGGRTVLERAPESYQVIGGVRRTVWSGFHMLGRGRVGFDVGSYDRERPLVVDPTIVYSTQLVGSAPGEGLGIAVDQAGDSYVTGETTSANFPTEHPLQAQRRGTNESAFVAKLNPTGALVYATYLGGSAYTEGRGIAVDAAGDAYVTGATNSTDFPTTKEAFQPSFGGGPFDAFVTKLDAAGSGLVYSTFLGDTHYDEGNAIAVDPEGRAVITGKTASPNFPLAHPLAPHTSSGAFVTKLTRTGSRLVSSTVFGGNGPGNHADSGFGIAVDREGDAYVTGETNDPGFPTVAALQPELAGGGNAFVIKINAASTRVIYATYLGGSGDDEGRAIAADGDGDAYVTGQATSRDFPTASPLQAANASPGPSGANAFVTKIDPSGAALVYSTYLGGSGEDGASGIAVDRAQDVYVTGQTSSADFPVVSPLQHALHGPSDAFVTKLDRSGSFIAFSTYFGGSGSDAGLAVALDPRVGIHLTGQTASPDFPRRGPHHGPKRYATPGDGGFVTVLHLALPRSVHT
jgi:hypothetical protein